MMRFYSGAIACLVVLTISVPAGAQDNDRRAVRLQVQGSPPLLGFVANLDEKVIANAPFSADATTTVTQTLGDGTKIEQKTTAKWYRDSTGRVRREQTAIGLDRLNPSAQPQTTITFDSVPGDPSPYMLDPTTRSARRAPRAVQWLGGVQWLARDAQLTVGRDDQLAVGGVSFRPYFRAAAGASQGGPVPSDIKPTEEQLGTRQVEGVKATGRRTTTVIPAGRIGNDRPIQITDEQWESPELNLLLSSRFSDPRTGVVEYRLTNISRAEPRADLFAVPAGYTEVANTPGLRNGGPAAQPGQGGRGGRGGGRSN
jgi:hypothetical protein